MNSRIPPSGLPSPARVLASSTQRSLARKTAACFAIAAVRLYWRIFARNKSVNTIRLGGLYLGKLRLRGSGNRVFLDGNFKRTKIDVYGNNNKIHIGKGSVSNLVIRMEGHDQELSIQEHRGIVNTTIIMFDSATRFSVGENTGLGGSRFVLAGRENYVEIGRDCMIADHTEFWATDSHSLLDASTMKRINRDQPIRIGDHVWICQGAKVLKGVQIRHDAVVGMGSVVVRDVEAATVSAGNPNREIRKNITWRRERLEMEA